MFKPMASALDGIGVMDHYTLNQKIIATLVISRFIMMNLTKPTTALRIIKEGTFCLMTKSLLGRVIYGNGNNKEDGSEGVHYKMFLAPYFHGPILSRNANLAYRLVTTALHNKYGTDIQLPRYEDILA